MTFRLLLSLALAALLVGSSHVLGQGDSKTCPLDGPLSCHSKPSPSTDSCCFLSPGGLLLQTQFWDTKPSTGPTDSWTIHGLWPDNCDGSFEQFCDNDRLYEDIRGILTSFNKTGLVDHMDRYWKDIRGHDDNLWQHEWNKHGTCVNTLESRCYHDYTAQEEVVDYFQRAVDLFRSLNTYRVLESFGIKPDITKSYSLEEITQALTNVSGVTPSVRCRHGELNEVWYFFNVRGSAQLGKYVPVHPDGDKSNCPSSGIKYLPKHPTSRPRPPSGPPGKPGPFRGRGLVKVSVGGQTRGCLIGSGQWYSTGSCATYTAEPTENDGEFTLRSSRGHCAVSRGSLRCNHAVKPGYVFKAIDDTLTFYSDAVPRGYKKVTLYEDPDHRYELKLYWKGAARYLETAVVDQDDGQEPFHS